MPDTSGPSERVEIGIIVGSHGLQGTVKVNPRTDFPERFAALKSCFVCRDSSDIIEVTIRRSKFSNRMILLTFDGVRTREEADRLRGSTIEIPISERWTLPENTFYISDLIECAASDEHGQPLGTVKEVIRGPQDILVIQGESGELLVPFVSEWVGRTDINSRVIEIRNATRLKYAEEIPPAVGESDD